MERLKNMLQNEQNQRFALQLGAAVVSIVVSQAVAGLTNKGLNLGIDALMAKLHPIIEDAAG